MITQKWHVEATGSELSRKKVPGFLNASLPKNWTASNVISGGVYPIVETVKPDITNLQRIEAGTRVRVGDEYHRVWNVVDKFSDIDGGLTKAEQETAYLADLEATAITTKKTELKTLFVEKMLKPLVDTGLGFYVDGGRDNLQDFQGGLALNLLIVRDSENVMHTVTSEEMTQIITAIQSNGAALYQRKWELEALIDINPGTDITTGWP